MNQSFQFEHPSGIKINSGLQLACLKEFVHSNPRFVPEDYNNGWVWYPLPAAEAGDGEIGFRLGFLGESLHIVEMFDLDPDLYGKDWDDWDRYKEALRAQNTGRWLQSLGYSTGEFPWGTVWCGYNEKSHVGGAIVRYRRAEPVDSH